MKLIRKILNTLLRNIPFLISYISSVYGFFTLTKILQVLPPFHTIHSENWAVYSFYNEKARRAELVSLEMYEGKSQTNATVFSSIENKVSNFFKILNVCQSVNC